MLNKIKDNKIKYIDGANGPANKNRLCVKGRFGFDYVVHPDRLQKPLIRIKGKEKDLHPVINSSNSPLVMGLQTNKWSAISLDK